MERENQRIALTKRLLKEGMLRLLKSKDPDQINVTELCREAGINRATFYRHYQIPRDVLLEIEQDLYRDLRLRVPMPQKAEELYAALEKLCEYMEQNAELLQIIVKNNSDIDFAQFVSGICQEVWQEVRHLGVLQNLNDEDVHLLTLYCAGGSYFILRQWLLGNIQKSPQQMASYVYGLMKKTDWNALGSQLGLLSD